MSTTTHETTTVLAVSAHVRHLILRTHALFLIIASIVGLVMDLSGIFLSKGPEAAIIRVAPYTGVGFVEAHGLAFIIGVALWGVAPLGRWHLTGAAIAVLLGASNVVFWQTFIALDLLPAGYVTTSLHCVFAVLQLVAAASARTSAHKTMHW